MDRKFDISTGKFVNRVSGEAIPDDEPVFIFRARDKHALSVLLHYLTIVEDEHHELAILQAAIDFGKFRKEHPERMKEPGITRHINLDFDPARDLVDPLSKKG